MLVIVKSVFDCNSNRLFDEVKKSKLLLYISKPLVKFVPLRTQPLPRKWREGKYLVEMYLLGFIPLGEQWIVITIDHDQKHIRDNGHSKLINRWDHHINLTDLGNNKTLYTDSIDIEAGALTLFIVLFACAFYRWRQKRCKMLIKHQFNYNR